MRNKLQHNAIVLMLKNHCMQCDDIHMLQYVRLCLILQLISGSAKNSRIQVQDAAVWQLAFGVFRG